MKIHNLGKKNSLFNQFISEIRDVNIQQDTFRFRRNLERIGEIFAYEISKKLDYQDVEVITSLGSAEMKTPIRPPVLATILRAGLPLHQGLLNYFDKSPNAFVSAYRKVYKDGNFKIHVDYCSSPDLNDEVLILSDSMLATGSSMVLCYRDLMTNGKPKHTHIVSAIASVEGVEFLKKSLPSTEVTLWLGALDDEMTAQSYIVPGLGDAGDLAFGKKD